MARPLRIEFPGVQQSPLPRRSPFQGTVQVGAGGEGEPPAGALPLRGAEPGACRHGRTAGAASVEQLSSDPWEGCCARVSLYGVGTSKFFRHPGRGPATLPPVRQGWDGAAGITLGETVRPGHSRYGTVRGTGEDKDRREGDGRGDPTPAAPCGAASSGGTVPGRQSAAQAGAQPAHPDSPRSARLLADGNRPGVGDPLHNGQQGDQCVKVIFQDLAPKVDPKVTGAAWACRW